MPHHFNSARTVGNGVEVKKTQLPFLGLGLFATIPFKRLDFITEFYGERITHQQAMDGRPTSHIRTLESHHECIDGERKIVQGKGAAQFANDGKLHKLNNARLVNVWDNSTASYRCFLRALCDISPHEEICTSYGSGYWKRIEQK